MWDTAEAKEVCACANDYGGSGGGRQARATTACQSEVGLYCYNNWATQFYCAMNGKKDSLSTCCKKHNLSRFNCHDIA